MSREPLERPGRRIVVAIDGPAGAGKSTIARRIAERLGFLYIDSGAMYRAVALWALRNGTPLDDASRLGVLAEAADIGLMGGRVSLNGEDVTDPIRTSGVSEAASRVAAMAGVRRALVVKQRAYREQSSVVMEGRDIGSVVFPDAEIKIYLDASALDRARRRSAEIGTDEQVLVQEMGERDQRDRTRAESPLVQAPDAVYLDSSGKSIEEVEEAVLQLIRARTANGKELHRT
jgi:cytidylate kinase